MQCRGRRHLCWCLQSASMTSFSSSLWAGQRHLQRLPSCQQGLLSPLPGPGQTQAWHTQMHAGRSPHCWPTGLWETWSQLLNPCQSGSRRRLPCTRAVPAQQCWKAVASTTAELLEQLALFVQVTPVYSTAFSVNCRVQMHNALVHSESGKLVLDTGLQFCACSLDWHQA